ncbi:sulfurtransferase-like selenium metabolism protein YedF [candidate division KSB3 bacterium]|uniref:Sulfurtransferase-like selenium metabolism protein YedF n=1 Tax=candidate division KSB3 bacterium TaxID=2044937 RepID=A0A9D5JX02_9BACT|nr:sulfurtransferase-like selenium metabolism protein YedF [candidate division KSB3 bacterium]MBD3325684.1 sulfurtransferase-like selenium metabolism protein YedF [candidate division KSB3 bacterium]
MAKIVDARRLACPQPVIQTRNALQEANEVITIVDNETSQNNVTRMAQKMGCTVQPEEKSDGLYLHISKSGDVQVEQQSRPVSSPAADEPLVLLVPDALMGRGDPELGGILIRAFFHTLGEVQPLPDTIIFLNSGVKLVIEGSNVLEDLQHLSNQGIDILACGTCLGHYDLKDKVRVGEISNMYTIAETLLNAGKVVSL